MILPADKERVQTLLRDTITLLCKNGLAFKTEFSVEALIGITLDKQDVFLININEIIKLDNTDEAQDEATIKDKTNNMLVNTVDQEGTKNHRKRQKSSDTKSSDTSKHDLFSSDTIKIEHDDWTHPEATSLDDDSDLSEEVLFSEPPRKKPSSSNQDTTAAPQNKEVDTLVKSEEEEEEEEEELWDGEEDEDGGDDYHQTFLYRTHGGTETAHISSDTSQEASVFGMNNSSAHILAHYNTDRSQTNAAANVLGGLQGKTAEQIVAANSVDLVGSMYNDMIGLSEPSAQRGGAPSWSKAKDGSPSGTAYLPYPCQLCGKRYLKRDGLVRHLKTHDDSLHRCKRCTLFFNSEELLNQHILSRHTPGSLKHTCPVCGKKI